MRPVGSLVTISLVLSLSVGLALTHDEDLQFEDPPPSTTAIPVRRLWGVPDFQAVVGKLFVASIPPDAFSGDVDFFEVSFCLRMPKVFKSPIFY